MKDILIFDFDGVLADTLQLMLTYAGQVCQELGYSCEPTQADLEALERMEFSEYGRQLGIPEEKIGTFVTRNFELFLNHKEPLAITPGLEPILTELSTKTTLAIVTGNSKKVVGKFLKTYGLKEKFRIMLCAEDQGNRVDKINKIQDLLSSQCGEVYMIGDAVSDIRSARKAGVKSVAVAWGHQSQQKLAAEHPDYLVESPEDLLSLITVDNT
jgi:phosphoglycolate phosphatase-like HAD superfamily hydrolase